MIGRADIEESKSSVAKIARLLQASYPCGNFSVTHVPNRQAHGIPRPGFPPSRASQHSVSSRIMPLYSTRGFPPRCSHLRTSALSLSSRAAPAKLPTCIPQHTGPATVAVSHNRTQSSPQHASPSVNTCITTAVVSHYRNENRRPHLSSLKRTHIHTC